MSRTKPAPQPAPVDQKNGGLRIRARLRALYHGSSPVAVRFRLAVLIIDLLIIAFFIAAPLLRMEGLIFYIIDYVIAALLLADLAARASAYSDIKAWLRKPIVWVDLFVFATLLFPFLFNLGFLRVLRLWTLIHSEFFWRTVGRRYDDTRVEDVTKALVSLITFVFVATGFVYPRLMGRPVGIHRLTRRAPGGETGGGVVRRPMSCTWTFASGPQPLSLIGPS